MFADETCVRVDQNAYNASEYLFPFVLEYSLIAMGILMMMYKSIGEEIDKRSNILRGIQNLFKIRALEMSATDELYGSADVSTILAHNVRNFNESRFRQLVPIQSRPITDRHSHSDQS